MEENLKKQWREARTDLIISIGKQLGIERDDQILMMMCLNTPEKIMKFSNWTKTKMPDNETVKAIPEQVVSAATRIGRGMEPLPDEAYQK